MHICGNVILSGQGNHFHLTCKQTIDKLNCVIPEQAGKVFTQTMKGIICETIHQPLRNLEIKSVVLFFGFLSPKNRQLIDPPPPSPLPRWNF